MGSRYLKNKNQLFCDFFKGWVEVYKHGAIATVTLNKYLMSQRRLTELAPELTLAQLDRRSYQEILNQYAVTHEKQTTLDFHRQLRSCIRDAIDDGMLTVDPTRKASIKGKAPAERKIKYLSCGELTALLSTLELENDPNWDWFILLVAKTGMRFAEALAFAPSDLDTVAGQIRVWHTWAYKSPAGGFASTKNTTSKRTVSIDLTLAEQLMALGTGRDAEQPLFVEGRVFNSQVNDRLAELCREARVPVISVHGLRHTHASALLHAGVSIASIAKRLGHANITTTQQTYLHVIRELEDKDNDIVISYLEALG
jgi:integrase